MDARYGEIRLLLSGGDRRSIADSNRVRRSTEADLSLVSQLAALAGDGMPIVRKHLRDFERSSSKALQARAKQIRARLAGPASQQTEFQAAIDDRADEPVDDPS